MRNKKSRKGLGLIAGLLARADVPIQTPGVYVDQGAIVDAAMDKIQTMRCDFGVVDELYLMVARRLREIIADAVKTAGEHATSAQRIESKLINDLVADDCLKRGENLMPAVVASVMEQLGMEEMRLDLGRVATVFERFAISFDVEGEVVTYKLKPIERPEDGRDNSVRFSKVEEGAVETTQYIQTGIPAKDEKPFDNKSLEKMPYEWAQARIKPFPAEKKHRFPQHQCKFCGCATWVAPSAQVAPKGDRCTEADHGWNDDE